jgi:putative DNA primase/helicase
MTDRPKLYCRICKKEVYPVGEPDDTGTQFYKCPQGHIRNNPITQEAKSLYEAAEIQAEQNQEQFFDPYNPLKAFSNDKGIFKPALAAEWIKNNYKIKTDISTGIIYFYNGQNWIKDAELYLHQVISKCLAEEDKKSHFENIKHHIIGITLEKISFSNLIACENGLLDVEKGVLSEFNAEEMPFLSIPVKYDPNAKCPDWERFLSQVITPEDTPTLQEWSGFCLLPNYSFHTMMWMLGNGRNGKGVWQRTIEGIIGPENISNIGLDEFDGNHRFAMYQLYGKLANFCSEPKTNKELQTSLLKYATGQDTIEAEIKNKQKRLSFKNYAKITVLANKFPKVYDQTLAFRERRLFLRFPNSFIGKNQIQNLEKVWLDNPEEKSGIVNWMLQGLHRLLKQGHFTKSRTQADIEMEFLRASDSINAFINETATYGKHLITTRSEAKIAYEAYCDTYDIETENEKKLVGRLRETLGIKDGKTRLHGEQERAWIGVSFKVLSDENEPEPHSKAQKALDFNNNGTFGTDGTGISISSNFSLLANSKNKEPKTIAPNVPSEPSPELNSTNENKSDNLFCRECTKHGLPCCEYPGDFEQVPNDHWAGECRGFSTELQPKPLAKERLDFKDKYDLREGSLDQGK